MFEAVRIEICCIPGPGPGLGPGHDGGGQGRASERHDNSGAAELS